MNIENGKCLHVVLFGTFNESKYFLGDYRDSFDLIGFNANIVAHAPEGLAGFISQLHNKSYFIDPQTHAFQQDIGTIKRKKDGEWVLKQSIKKLAKCYGSIIDKNVGKRSIEPQEISDNEIREICENVLFFQSNVIEQASQKLDVKYFIEDPDLTLSPEFLVAPYFYLEPDNLENELELNYKFTEETKNIVDDQEKNYNKPLFVEIVISKEILLDKDSMKKVIDQYTNCKQDGFLIWIDDFDETSVSKYILIKYRDFLIELNKLGLPIIALHGSFFSTVLSGNGFNLLAGTAHGIEYGEHRPVIPIGGGVPTAKFYFPHFFKRVHYHPDATNVLIEKNWVKNVETYLKNVCVCSMCEKIIRSNVVKGFEEYGETKRSEKNNKFYPTAMALNKSRKHYLNTKIEEYIIANSLGSKDIILLLEAKKNIAKDIDSYSFNHLTKWFNVLSDI